MCSWLFPKSYMSVKINSDYVQSDFCHQKGNAL